MSVKSFASRVARYTAYIQSDLDLLSLFSKRQKVFHFKKKDSSAIKNTKP